MDADFLREHEHKNKRINSEPENNEESKASGKYGFRVCRTCDKTFHTQRFYRKHFLFNTYFTSVIPTTKVTYI